MGEFRMPSLGADMDAGTLVAWRKRPGERVARGDIVAEVETDKGIIEVEVFEAGVLEAQLVSPGAKVPVGTLLATIRSEGANAPSGQAPAPKPAEPPPRSVPAGPAPTHVAPPAHRKGGAPGDRRKVSPLARRRAAERGVDTMGVAGTGHEGAVTLADVERAASAGHDPRQAAALPPSPPEGPEPSDPRARMRHAIAAAMARSKREIPHYYVSHTVDVTPALAWIEQHNATAAMPDRLIPAVLFLKAVALALREFPAFNGFWDGGLRPSAEIHLGAAIALRGGGLVAPAIRNTDQLGLRELMHHFRELVTRARSGTLRSSEMSDTTLTVTSLGDRGAEAVLGVIYPPQVAIVGFGRVVERPWVVSGAVVPRKVVHVSLAADHRATDGHAGALFLAAIADRLMDPEHL